MATTSACLPKMIYASPRFLNLHLFCSDQTPFRKNLGRWPEFPLIVSYRISKGQDIHIAALKHPDRIHRVDLTITSSDAEEVVAAMQMPFPVLTHLELTGPNDYSGVLDLPSQFLGGSAPCLQHLRFDSVFFSKLKRFFCCHVTSFLSNSSIQLVTFHRGRWSKDWPC